jgi:hypothetical protein
MSVPVAVEGAGRREAITPVCCLHAVVSNEVEALTGLMRACLIDIAIIPN